MADGRVEDIYTQLKERAVSFQLRPGDRLNEGALARDLGVSRTPLREALNRLVAEKLFDFKPGSGFFCRTLDPQAVFDLYELRQILECSAARLTAERASDADLGQLATELQENGLSITGLTIAEACARDEAFHLGIARLSGNAELLSQLQRTNEKIRYIRWVRLSVDRLSSSKDEHLRIMQALRDRDGAAAADILQGHILNRKDQVTEAVRLGISSIYLDAADPLAGRVLQAAPS